MAARAARTRKKLGKKLGIPPGLCLLTPFQVPFPHGEEVAWKCWTATASSDVNSLTSRSYWQCHAADGAILSMEPGACDISLSRPRRTQRQREHVKRRLRAWRLAQASARKRRTRAGMHKLALAAALIGRRSSSTVPRTTTTTRRWGAALRGFDLADGRRTCAGTGQSDGSRGRRCCSLRAAPRACEFCTSEITGSRFTM